MIGFNNYKVSVYQAKKAEYPEGYPFHPDEDYPEYVFRGRGYLSLDNPVYEAIRQVFYMLGLDKENYGTPAWNPLVEIVKPGDKVVLKPNFVRDYHENGEDIFCIITHPSVIRAIADYVYIALQGDGQIVIADAPQGDSNFENLLAQTRIESIADLYRQALDFQIPILDLRKMRYEYDKSGYISRRFELEGDPLGYISIDLGMDSEFAGLGSCKLIYGADYDRKETLRHHNEKINEYLVSKTILSADVIISIPKLKVHRKAGVTLNLKNMVGINGDKNWLPHFRLGSPVKGGDEVPQDSVKGLDKVKSKVNRMLMDHLSARGSASGELVCKAVWRTYKGFKGMKGKIASDMKPQRKISSGDWYGNDTIWRTVLDLDKIVVYADKDGHICQHPQRRLFSIVDGVIGGEGEGPMKASPKKSGVIIAGSDFVIVDLVATSLMGFDYKKLPLFKSSIGNLEYQHDGIVNVSQINVTSNIADWSGTLDHIFAKSLSFAPPRGWIGYIELVYES